MDVLTHKKKGPFRQVKSHKEITIKDVNLLVKVANVLWERNERTEKVVAIFNEDAKVTDTTMTMFVIAPDDYRVFKEWLDTYKKGGISCKS